VSAESYDSLTVGDIAWLTVLQLRSCRTENSVFSAQ